MQLHKKIVINEYGKPSEVIIPWDQFQEIAEILGLDLNTQVLQELEQARNDRENDQLDAYVSLDGI